MTITISDAGQTLSPAQRDALTAKAAAYPFDIYVEIQTQYALSRASFENVIAQHVTPGSRIVAIGVDPLKHYTFVRSSASLNVPPGPQVAQAGNAFFKRGNLVDGIDAIAAKANELRTEPVAMALPKAGPDTRIIQSQTGVPIVINEHHTSAGVWWGVGAFVLVAGAIVAWFVWRAKKRDQAVKEAQDALDLEASELRARNIEEQSWHDEMAAKRGDRSVQASTPLPVPRRIERTPSERTYASYRSPAPPVVVMPSAPPQPVIQNGSNNLDTLLAYELGRESSRPSPVIVEREAVIERQSESSSSSWSSSSADDSSSSSTWGGSDDSSSSSSFDSGSGNDSSSGSEW